MVNPFDKYLTREDWEHIAVVNFLRDNLPTVIYFHVPNEGMRTPFERYKYSLMGNLKGVSDFIFMHPKLIKKESGHGYDLQYLGLAIELKAPEHTRTVQKGKNTGKSVKSKGTLSPEQKEFLERMNKMKYRAVCCWGAEEAIKEIIAYFKK